MSLKIKALSLFFLCLQNLSFSFLVNKREDTPDSRIVVLLTEVVKFFVSLFLLFIFGSSKDYYSVFNQRTLLLISIPSLLYFFQNNLCYISLTRIPPLYFSLLYQTKILTTALFTTILFKKKFTKRKIIALFLLFCGVFFVQADFSSVHKKQNNLDVLIGIFSLCLASVFSGFTGVYTEWFLKKGNNIKGKKTNYIFISTLQSAFFGIIFSIISIFSSYLTLIPKKVFSGITNRTYLIVLNQSIGGLLVVITTKYADSVLKTFSTCISIVLFMLTTKNVFELSFLFKIGTVFVIIAVFLYN